MSNVWYALVLALAGCGVTTSAALINPRQQYAKTCPDDVTFYTSSDRVPGVYQEVALLTTTDFVDEDQIYYSQRSKAAELGANGIILRGEASAVAIYLPKEPAPPAPCRARDSLAVPTTYGTAGPAPRPAPVTHSHPARVVDAVPAGSQFIADTKTHTYFRVGCPASLDVPDVDRFYYQSEVTLIKEGYTQNERC